MNLYAGDVDGIDGPNTRKAIETYRKAMGMEISGDIDDACSNSSAPATPPPASSRRR